MKNIFRLLKNSFWYLVVMAIGILYFEYAPLNGAAFWLGFLPLAAIAWIVISKLRERLHF